LASSKIRILRSLRSKKGLKTVQGQDQDRFGQDQDLSKNSLKTKTGLKDYITG